MKSGKDHRADVQTIEHDTLVLQSGHHMRPLRAWLIVAVVVLGSIRGILVVHSSLPVEAVYLPVVALLFLLVGYGYIQRIRYKEPRLVLLKTLMKLNVLLGVVNFAVDYLIGAPIMIGWIYMLFAPHVVFLFLGMPIRYLNAIVIVITMVLGYSILENFINMLISGAAGVQYIHDYNVRLRPDTDRALIQTSGIYHVAGYTGSYHDSANILGMVLPFFFVRFLVRRKLLDLGLTLFAMLCMFPTQSSANEVFAVCAVVAFSGYVLFRSKKTIASCINMFLVAFSVIVLGVLFEDVVRAFLQRFEKADWESLLSFLDMDLLSEAPIILFGHGFAYDAFVTGTEVATLGIIGQLGIVHAVVLFWILLYPLLCFVKAHAICFDALPSAAAVFFGFISTLHYNSLGKVTSFFLFSALYAMCLKSIFDSHDSGQVSSSVKVSRNSSA